MILLKSLSLCCVFLSSSVHFMELDAFVYGEYVFKILMYSW